MKALANINRLNHLKHAGHASCTYQGQLTAMTCRTVLHLVAHAQGHNDMRTAATLLL
jgi:hypothetical protein